MISITILELLYLVLTAFLIVIGTLLSLVLLRTLKILRVVTDLADIYFKIKVLAANANMIPDIIKERILAMVEQYQDTEEEERSEPQK